MKSSHSFPALLLGGFAILSVKLICQAYPERRSFEEQSSPTKERHFDISLSTSPFQTALNDGDLAEVHYPWKRDVSTLLKSISEPGARKTREVSSIDEGSDDPFLDHSVLDMKILDDLPASLEQTIEGDPKNDDSNEETGDVSECLTKISNALYSSEFWNGIAQRLAQSALPESFRSFFGFPANDILQIGDNGAKQKREIHEKSKCSEPAPSGSYVGQIVQQFIPASASHEQQVEMQKCIGDATSELQNLLDQFKSTCDNLRQGISLTGPSKCSKCKESPSATPCEHAKPPPPPPCVHAKPLPPPPCEHIKVPTPCEKPEVIQSAPVLIQTVMENPEYIMQIPEMIQSSVPCTQMSDSLDKLKNSFKKIFGLIQECDSQTGESDCLEEESPKCFKRKKLQKIHKCLQGWRSRKTCKSCQYNDSVCDECSAHQTPNTIVLNVPTSAVRPPPVIAHLEQGYNNYSPGYSPKQVHHDHQNYPRYQGTPQYSSYQSLAPPAIPGLIHHPEPKSVPINVQPLATVPVPTIPIPPPPPPPIAITPKIIQTEYPQQKQETIPYANEGQSYSAKQSVIKNIQHPPVAQESYQTSSSGPYQPHYTSPPTPQYHPAVQQQPTCYQHGEGNIKLGKHSLAEHHSHRQKRSASSQYQQRYSHELSAPLQILQFNVQPDQISQLTSSRLLNRPDSVTLSITSCPTSGNNAGAIPQPIPSDYIQNGYPASLAQNQDSQIIPTNQNYEVGDQNLSLGESQQALNSPQITNDGSFQNENYLRPSNQNPGLSESSYVSGGNTQTPQSVSGVILPSEDSISNTDQSSQIEPLCSTSDASALPATGNLDQAYVNQGDNLEQTTTSSTGNQYPKSQSSIDSGTSNTPFTSFPGDLPTSNTDRPLEIAPTDLSQCSTTDFPAERTTVAGNLQQPQQNQDEILGQTSSPSAEQSYGQIPDTTSGVQVDGLSPKQYQNIDQPSITHELGSESLVTENLQAPQISSPINSIADGGEVKSEIESSVPISNHLCAVTVPQQYPIESSQTQGFDSNSSDLEASQNQQSLGNNPLSSFTTEYPGQTAGAASEIANDQKNYGGQLPVLNNDAPNTVSSSPLQSNSLRSSGPSTPEVIPHQREPFSGSVEESFAGSPSYSSPQSLGRTSLVRPGGFQALPGLKSNLPNALAPRTHSGSNIESLKSIIPGLLSPSAQPKLSKTESPLRSIQEALSGSSSVPNSGTSSNKVTEGEGSNIGGLTDIISGLSSSASQPGSSQTGSPLGNLGSAIEPLLEALSKISALSNSGSSGSASENGQGSSVEALAKIISGLSSSASQPGSSQAESPLGNLGSAIEPLLEALSGVSTLSNSGSSSSGSEGGQGSGIEALIDIISGLSSSASQPGSSQAETPLGNLGSAIEPLLEALSGVSALSNSGSSSSGSEGGQGSGIQTLIDIISGLSSSTSQTGSSQNESPLGNLGSAIEPLLEALSGVSALSNSGSSSSGSEGGQGSSVEALTKIISGLSSSTSQPGSSQNESSLGNLGSAIEPLLEALSGVSALSNSGSSSNGSEGGQGSGIEALIDIISGLSSSASHPGSSQAESPLGNLGSAIEPLLEALSGVSALSNSGSSSSGSEGGQGSGIEALIDIISGLSSSASQPGSSQTESPLGNLGSAIEPLLEALSGVSALSNSGSSSSGSEGGQGSGIEALIDIISGLSSSASQPGSSQAESPLGNLGSAIEPLLEALSGVSTLLSNSGSSSSGSEGGQGSGIEALIDVISGLSSSASQPGSSQTESPLGNLGSAIEPLLEALSGVSALSNSGSSSSGSEGGQGSGIEALIDVISGLSSSTSHPGSSQTELPLGNLGSAIEPLLEAASGVSTLSNSGSSSSGHQGELGSNLEALLEIISGLSSSTTHSVSSSNGAPLSILGSIVDSPLEALPGLPPSHRHQGQQGSNIEPLFALVPGLSSSAGTGLPRAISNAGDSLQSLSGIQGPNIESIMKMVSELPTSIVETIAQQTSSLSNRNSPSIKLNSPQNPSGRDVSSTESFFPHAPIENQQALGKLNRGNLISGQQFPLKSMNINPLETETSEQIGSTDIESYSTFPSSVNSNQAVSSPTLVPPNVGSSNPTLIGSVSSIFDSAATFASSLSTAMAQIGPQNQQAQIQSLSIPSRPALQLSKPSNIGDAQMSVTLPRDKICSAVDGGIVLPGDTITISINPQTALVGRVLDFVSPVSLQLIQKNSLLPVQPRENRVWNISGEKCGEFQNLLGQLSTTS